jgi:SAM-dependent methyltransferase
MTDFELHNAQQRAYFEAEEDTGYMEPAGSPYVRRQVRELAGLAELEAGHRVLDAGCGMGRYTFALADLGLEVEGLDLSPHMLERLREFDAGQHHFALHCADLLDPPAELLGRFDAVAGFFTLHHVPDVGRCLAASAAMVKPGGRVAYLEPNPYNPLYYVQLALAPGMSWEGERGILNMRSREVLDAMSLAGLADLRFKRFGFLPPAVVNRTRGTALEARLERVGAFRPVLPFQLFVGTRPAGFEPATSASGGQRSIH